MKRFSKVMISMLIVVVMLAQMFPASLLVTPASAATNGQRYEYVLVTNPTPGKTYLLASAGSGASSAYIVGVSDGTSEGGKVTSKKASISGSTISEFDGIDNYEWKILKGEPAATDGNGNVAAQYGSATFMFQNEGTNAYLYNPVYESGSNDEPYGNMFVTYNPLIDNYDKATRIIFDSTIAYKKYVTSTVQTTATPAGPWLQLITATAGDVQANINLYGFSTSQYNSMSMTYHPVNVSGSGNATRVFTNTSDKPGPNGNYAFSWATGADNWTSVYGQLDLSNSNNFTWDNGSAWTGTVNSMRLDYRDPGKAGDGMYVNSIIFHQCLNSAETTAYRREVSAWYGKGSGFYPSHRFQNTQFANLQSTTLTSGLVLCSSGASVNNSYGNYAHYQYYFGFGANTLKRAYANSSTVSPVYYYEKRCVNNSEGSYTWQRVVNANQLTADGEYIIINRKCSGANQTTTQTALFADNENGGLEYLGRGGVTLTTSNYKAQGYNVLYDTTGKGADVLCDDSMKPVSTDVRSEAVWRIAKLSTSATGASSDFYFYLINSKTGNIIYDYESSTEAGLTGNNPNSSATIKTMGQGATGGAVPYGQRYIWKYNFTDESLYAYSVAQNQGETATSVRIGYSTGNVKAVLNDTCYIYKKTYCAHNDTVVKSNTQATCTTDGLYWVYCNDCKTDVEYTVKPALGHNLVDNSKAPTCTAAGYTLKECSRCDYEERATVTATGHNWQVVSTNGSCTTPSTVNYKCANCGQTKTETGQVIGHNYGTWYTVTYATTTSVGQERRDCSRCDAFETREIPMLESSKLVGSTETTTVGGTATVTFELRQNPGIWAQNFVIYYPEALTFVKAESSDDVFPLGNVEGNENKPVDPTTNARMAAYFADAGIANPGNYMAWAYYVDNGALENTYKDGVIVKLTFKVPGSNCLKEYPIGVFGVYASSGNDLIDVDGKSIKDFAYISGKILIPNGVDCPHTNYTVVTDKEATCTTDGAQHKVCNTCRTEFDKEVIAATGHSYGDPVVIQEPNESSAGIMRKSCIKCGYYIDEEFGEPTGSILAGDANGDGRVNSRDVLALKKYIAGAIDITTVKVDNMDIDGNGRVTSKDALALKKLLV